ncbi:acetyl-CoA carboxylase biotin carboxyl carrier protein [Rhodovibrio salinarum]|uniref:Biotin carboxyl carrier protein of acetyl-CoA carboxylase n=1 Tax=Rhodovibrio salinarum TaxID=1087 RepID=A0A934UZ21_9PROT|nr:acetyl-CoA carboxylase biotin carboxyl carrier protein [Rhodovibrio salinarum]MBK1695890.1 acetyl-CoA carboxylase, biotin carboxyl carrier protein [Rhodovibrio salinarum]
MADDESRDDFNFDEEVVRRLSHLLKETDLSEIEVETGGHRIRVARQINVQASAPAAPAPAPQPQGGGEAASAPKPGPEATAEQVPPGAVTSPMVGTVYTAPDPNSAAFVQVGDKVSEGQTLLIIEAMKVMNPLPAPRAGTVSQILISDGQPVEFGEPLLVVE